MSGESDASGEHRSVVGENISPYYYLDNFLSLCNSVERQYDDLLTSEETSFLRCFSSLDKSAQCLYVRLISRTGPWFRVNKLAYSEIGGLAEPMQVLFAAELVEEAVDLSTQELGKLYTKPELEFAFAELLEKPRAGSKAELLSLVESSGLDCEQQLAQIKASIAGQLIAPVSVEIVERLQILFFGNRHQGLTDFVLSDLGLAKYYPYDLNTNNRLFPVREALDEYLYNCDFQDVFYQFLELDDAGGIVDLAEALVEMEINFPQNQHRWDRLFNTVARELERREHNELALSLYIRSGGHPARERRARIFAASEDWPAVVDASEEILSDPWTEAEKEAGKVLLARARRKLGGPALPRRVEQFQEARLTLSPSGQGVELDAADYLGEQWRSVHFVENSLLNTLFGLAFWQQIFADVPGAFDNPYQGVPRDMYHGGFFRHRTDAIERRMRALRNCDLREELLMAFRCYSQYQCHWTDWRTVDEHLLGTALEIIPRQHLLAIWERQLFDPAENRSGFPDLIAFGSGGVGDYCMIEVKGPGDTLQNNQKRWLRYFSEQAIPASVAWVEWADG